MGGAASGWQRSTGVRAGSPWCASHPGQPADGLENLDHRGSAADEFLKATIPTITSNPAYSAHGLIVITFGTVGNATASSLPAGSSTATLGSEPPAGVLLISPFARADTRPSMAYDPTSPKQSLSALLH